LPQRAPFHRYRTEVQAVVFLTPPTQTLFAADADTQSEVEPELFGIVMACHELPLMCRINGW
jgi:hypothetical protein